MRILIVSQYFHPEVTAASFRIEPLAAGLAARGHEVEVLCEAPNHPRGIVPPDYRGRLVSRKWTNGYRTSYVWVRASPSRSARSRMLSYGSYAAAALAVGAAMRRPDVIFASSPPLSVGAVGRALGSRHRVPWVMDVRDLWPEAAVALGELHDGPAFRLAAGLERHLYRSAERITTPTGPFASQIGALSDPGKVHVLANGTTRDWLSAAAEPADRLAAGLPDDRFVWTYAGNIGLSQNLEVAIDAAGLLGQGFRLLLLGDGTRRPALERRANQTNGADVEFRQSVSPSIARGIMRASDALIVTLADDAALAKSVPVKLYDSCAVGRPVIVAAPGEARRLADESAAAMTVSPGDPRALAAAITLLRDDEALASQLAAAGREFAGRNLREAGIEQLEMILAAVVTRR